MARGFIRITGMGPVEKQLDLLGPITSDERSVRASLKHVDDFKKSCQDPPGSVHEMLYLIHTYQLIFNQPCGANLY